MASQTQDIRVRTLSSSSTGSGGRPRTFSSGSGYNRAVLLAIDASDSAKHAFECKIPAKYLIME